jgi:hypothetical protein
VEGRAGGALERDFPKLPRAQPPLIAGQGKSVPAEYAQPDHVDGEVIEQIVSWIGRARRDKGPGGRETAGEHFKINAL